MTIIITDTEIQGASRSFPTFRNKLLNGNFWINQRMVSGTVNLLAGVYAHDGWKAGAAGCQYTFVASGNDVIITIISGTLVQTVGSDYIQGGSHCLSWAGTSQGRVVSGSSGSLAGPFAASPVTIGNLTAGATATVEFGVGTLSYAQLEEGLYSRVFERKDPRAEFWRAKRYFRTSYSPGVAFGTVGTFANAWRGFSLDTSNLIVLQQFEEPMAGNPTFVIYNPSSGATSSVRGTASGASVALSGSSTFHPFGIYSLTSTAGYTQGTLYDFHFTAAVLL